MLNQKKDRHNQEKGIRDTVPNWKECKGEKTES